MPKGFGWHARRRWAWAQEKAEEHDMLIGMKEPDYMDELTYDDRSHTYRLRGRLIPHITEIVPSDYSHVPPEHLERARQRGTAVHKATELYDLGTLNWSTLDPKVEPYLEAWALAKVEYELEFADHDIERRLFHPIDCYGGTGDRPRCWITPPGKHRRLATVEIKSIAKMDENVGLQTAGQQRCENYRARKLGIAETVDRWGFQLKKDGTYFPAQYSETCEERVFLSYLIALNWEVKHGKKSYADASQRTVGSSSGNGSAGRNRSYSSAGGRR